MSINKNNKKKVSINPVINNFLHIFTSLKP